MKKTKLLPSSNKQFCFSNDEVQQFVEKLFDDIFPNGKAEMLDNFYTVDFVGHNRGKIFNFSDVQDRLVAIKKYTKKTQFFVQEFVLINDLIALSCRQTWINKQDKSVHDATVFVIYRIKHKKICEAWIMLDLESEDYAAINKNFSKNLQSFELNKKDKQDFLRRLNIIQQAQDNKLYKLSKLEQECLYYYFHGFSAKEAGLEMQLSPRTIEDHLSNIKDKYGCRNKRELRKQLFPDNKV